jgi:hypothetical protein
LIQAVHKKLTESAHEARKAEPVQEIIEDRARGLWGRKMWFKDNDNGTASTILDDVNKDICKLQNDRPREVPQTWRVPGTPSKVWKEKAINRIAGRLKRIKCSDR